MNKAVLIVYIVSLLGTGNGVRQQGQYSTFNSMQDCQQALSKIFVKDTGKDISGRVVAYCAAPDVKKIEGQ